MPLSQSVEETLPVDSSISWPPRSSLSSLRACNSRLAQPGLHNWVAGPTRGRACGCPCGEMRKELADQGHLQGWHPLSGDWRLGMLFHGAAVCDPGKPGAPPIPTHQPHVPAVAGHTMKIRCLLTFQTLPYGPQYIIREIKVQLWL